ncbi:MAG: TerC family protein [Phycisphaerales bacterium]
MIPLILAAAPAGAIPPLVSVESALALLTLTLMEIVLGIDNIIFIAILSGKLPPDRRATARRLGLLGAMFMRIALLLVVGWIAALKTPWLTFSLLGHAVELSWRDVILLVGGLFLIAKATHEIHERLEGEPAHEGGRVAATLGGVIAQIMVMDIIFSIDSVITAVGMAEHLEVMIAAVVIAVLVMMVFAGRISDFVERHPTIKMLALSFLLLIGVMLVVEAVDVHVSKGYIYFAMAFSLFVEMLNLRLKRKSRPIELRSPTIPR